ncbi:helix-turn-helix transcriptional regulator [Ekhidna sp.]|uniref:helix-turn-helix transcriptional regulator n=1 Tax=Ekhidna sp. TaxID=2608089 RepID=UPI00329956A0
MHYESFAPTDSLKKLVKEYWIFENEDPTIQAQKIIPDGFSEIIIHYGESYRINLSGRWEPQASMLFSSQISKFFFLENTGRSGIIGIKLHPTAFYELFQKDVADYTDRVVALDETLHGKVYDLRTLKQHDISINQRVQLAENWLEGQLQNLQPQSKVKHCVESIFASHGMIDIDQMAEDVQLSTRQLERLFKKVIGLSPKFYCRIIRFNYIFEVMKEQKDSWIRTALQSGFFDQSHFIKNFKEFTGEEPSNYGFDDVNLANFFLKK